MKLALCSTGRGVTTTQVTRRVLLRAMRHFALLLLPAALHASAVTSVDQLTAYFCGQPEIRGCEDYPVLPPQLPPIPEAPGYTLGPYVGMLTLDGNAVADYPGTIEDFVLAAIPAAENWGYSDGYASFIIDVSGGYVFTMNAGPELVSSIDPVPEPSSIVFVALGVGLIGAAHFWRRPRARAWVIAMLRAISKGIGARFVTGRCAFPHVLVPICHIQALWQRRQPLKLSRTGQVAYGKKIG